jgi:hypothetical protein
MVSGILSVVITQNERFLCCDTLLLGVRYNRPKTTTIYTNVYNKSVSLAHIASILYNNSSQNTMQMYYNGRIKFIEYRLTQLPIR